MEGIEMMYELVSDWVPREEGGGKVIHRVICDTGQWDEGQAVKVEVFSSPNEEVARDFLFLMQWARNSREGWG
jgi:hypothetical protein